MCNSCFNILAGTAYPRGEEFVILGASTIAKSSEKLPLKLAEDLEVWFNWLTYDNNFMKYPFGQFERWMLF